MTPDSKSALDFDDRSREIFGGLADVLIPAADGMPSATQVGAHQRWLDRALSARPDLAPRLHEIIDAAADSVPAAYIEEARRADPDSVQDLQSIATGAYYMSPKVRKRLGYRGRVPNPARPDESDYYLRDGILDPVIARGPVYREA